MEKEFATSQEQLEGAEQPRTEYENIQPMAM
jgi:hypothetical protein